jgi:uncharacterized protein YbaA (DUF1428 family)
MDSRLKSVSEDSCDENEEVWYRWIRGSIRRLTNKIMNGGYVDGFVFPITKKNVKAYTKMAAWGKREWMKYGALAYYECMGDDLAVKSEGGMKQRSFKDLAKAGGGDTVWFSFIVFRNKKHRNAVNKKVMAQMNKEAEKWKDMVMPMDPTKMAYGGFKVIVRG